MVALSLHDVMVALSLHDVMVAVSLHDVMVVVSLHDIMVAVSPFLKTVLKNSVTEYLTSQVRTDAKPRGRWGHDA